MSFLPPLPSSSPTSADTNPILSCQQRIRSLKHLLAPSPRAYPVPEVLGFIFISLL